MKIKIIENHRLTEDEIDRLTEILKRSEREFNKKRRIENAYPKRTCPAKN